MPGIKKEYSFITTILPWLLFSLVAWYLAYLRMQALDFHTRDYAYYTEFIIRFSQPSTSQYYSINPGGYGFLISSTLDGCDGFYQWIHLEPIRFIQAIVYKTTGSLQAVFLFNSLLVLSPILAIRHMVKQKEQTWLWILLFVVFPCTLLAPGYDNRPSVFLGTGYFWVMFFYLRSTKKWIQYSSFIFLFLIREEAVILNGFVCLYLLFQVIKNKSGLLFFLLHMVSLVVYAAVLYAYYSYWKYSLFTTALPHISPIAIIPICICLLVGILYVIINGKNKMFLFLPIVLFSIQLIILCLKNLLPGKPFSWYNDPRWMIVWPMIVFFLIYLPKNKFNLYFLSITGIFLLSLNLSETHGIVSRTKKWIESKERYTRLWNLRNTFSEQSVVLTDYSTHQCFVGLSNLYCVDRLPCKIIKNEMRFFPANKDFLLLQMQKGTYMILKQPVSEDLKSLIQNSGHKFSSERIDDIDIIRFTN